MASSVFDFSSSAEGVHTYEEFDGNGPAAANQNPRSDGSDPPVVDKRTKVRAGETSARLAGRTGPTHRLHTMTMTTTARRKTRPAAAEPMMSGSFS